MTHHLILGAGPAGVIAAETLRKHAPADRITLVGDESAPPYSRMAIPYLLMGKIGEDGTYLRKDGAHFDNLRIQQVKARVESVQTASKSVCLSNGQTLGYDTLLVATGSRPVRPPIAGMDGPGVHTCWTLDDARAIAKLATQGARVLQLGAGFIGCIIMEALAARGVKLTVVEMGDRMVPRMMGPVAGGMLKDWCVGKGISVHTGARVTSISRGAAAPQGLVGKLAQAIGIGGPAPDDGAMKVHLSTGEVLVADLVISAAGVRPAIDYLKESGVACAVGVLTDVHLQTNVPGVFAAGDCAEAFDSVSGTTVVSAIQPNASEQARIAALNMLAYSQGKALQARLQCVTQINVLDTLGLISTSFGNWQGAAGGEQVQLTDKAAQRHLSLQFQGDVLVGCNSVGWTEHVGVMRGLVEGQIHLGPWKDTLRQDPSRLAEAYLACAQGQGHWSGAQDTRRR